jgi:hypothetical protein
MLLKASIFKGILFAAILDTPRHCCTPAIHPM